ncbi:MAG: MBL fold metallo-hydrolase [Candidatus Diapherotrites archaeon]
MKLTVLGSGTILSKERNSAAYLLEHADAKVLVDFGNSALSQLKKVQDPNKIFSLFLTHAHSDHALDLISLLAYKKHLKFFKQGPDKSQFNLFGPKGTKEFFKNCQKAFPMIASLDFGVKATELDVSRFEHFVFTVKSRPVRHVVDTLAYRFEADGKSVVFSGDTSYCDAISSIAEGADLLVLECSMPNELKGSSHLTPEECGLIAAKANPKKLLLSHFYPMVEGTDILKEVRKNFKGEVVLAKDLMEVKV